MLNIAEMRRSFLADCRDEVKVGKQPKGERFMEMFESCLELGRKGQPGGINALEISLRGLFENFILDDSGAPCGYEIAKTWDMRHGSGLGQISLVRLMEEGAVQTTSFSNITGQIIYNEILKAYDLEKSVFTPLIPTIPTQFNGERIAGIGGIGNQAEIVNEGQVYPLVGVTEDFIDTPQTTKRGLRTALTREAVFFDRTGDLVARAAQVGQYLAFNKETRAIDCVIDENTTVHQYNRKLLGKVSTYGANSGNHTWNNLQTSNALANYTNVDLVDQLLYAILDPNTGLPIVMDEGQNQLIVSRGLLKAAEYIQRSTEQRVVPGGFATSGTPVIQIAPNVAPNYNIIVSRLLATRQALTTSWYYGNIKKAFRYMENWPLTTVEAPANTQLEFEQDIVMQWKSSERGQFIVYEPRYMVKATA